jgi:hypothetical protein
MKNAFNYIKAAKFFPDYAPNIPAWKKKISGKNSNGNPVDFTEAEKTEITKALKQLIKDLTKPS